MPLNKLDFCLDVITGLLKGHTKWTDQPALPQNETFYLVTTTTTTNLSLRTLSIEVAFYVDYKKQQHDIYYGVPSVSKLE